MTNYELIEILKMLPADLPVIFNSKYKTTDNCGLPSELIRIKWKVEKVTIEKDRIILEEI